MKPVHRPTSIDVAARAGVSQSTVSRALRGDTAVNLATRERIVRAARDLNYTLDRRGARLRSGSTSNIALVLLTAPGENRAALNPLYYALLGAVAAAASDRGLNLLVSFQDEVTGFRADFAQSREADGMVVIGSTQQEIGWQFFAAAGAAGERLICWGAPGETLPAIRCDNRAGATTAVEHLLAQGRRNVAFVGPGWRGHKAYRDRRQGYVDALQSAGATPFEVATAASTASREDQGHAAAIDLIERFPACDAIFAACDTLALGILRALRDAGRDVPRDVAVVGFDGIATAVHASPTLTTVEQDCRAAGILLVDALLASIAGQQLPPQTVPMRLVIRESSGRQPQAAPPHPDRTTS